MKGRDSMLKKVLARGLTAFAFGIAGGQMVVMIVALISGNPDFTPLVPEFAARFNSTLIAVGVQNLCTGLVGLAFGLSSFIFDIEKWGFLRQAAVYFMLTAAVWIPVSIFCWGLGTHPSALFSVLASFIFSYALTLFLQHMHCKKAVLLINKKLNELNSQNKGE